MGIIDTLSAGFARVARKPWLIVMPVVVDLIIALGPRLSIKGLSASLLPLLPNAGGLGAPYEETLEMMRAWVTEVGESSNVLSLLSMRVLGLPGVATTWAGDSARIVEVQSWATLVLLMAALFVLGLLAGTLTLSLAAQEAREDEMDLPYVLRVAGRAWGRLTRLYLVLGVTIAVLASGVSVLVTLLAWMSEMLAALALNLFAFGLLGIAVYAGLVLFFMPKAIVLDDIGLVQAFWNSLNVAYRNIVPTVALILLSALIRTGLTYVWQALAVNKAGALFGIVGNAYIGLGLAMAALIYYRDRFVAWQDAALLARTRRGNQ